MHKVPSAARALGVLGLLLAGGYVAAKAVSVRRSSTVPAPRSGAAPPRVPAPRLPLPDPRSAPAGWTLGTFPLNMQMRKSLLVQQLQQAILARGGAAATHIATTGGADGAFGAGLMRALQELGFSEPTAVSSDDFDRLVNPSAAGVDWSIPPLASVLFPAPPPPRPPLRGLGGVVDATDLS